VTASPESEKLREENMPWSPKRVFQKKLFRPAAEIPAKALLPELPRNFLKQFEPPNKDTLQYLREERGLYDYTIDHWELMYDPAPRWNRIVIPIRDHKGKLIAFSRRALYDYQDPKYWHMTGFKRRYYLFGEAPKDLEPASPRNRRGIIVEGQFDVIRLWQYGYRGAVAILGADMTSEQILKFKSLFSSGIALMDADAAGSDASEKLRQQFDAVGIPLEIAQLPDIEGLDPGSLKFTKDMAVELLGEPEVDNDWPL
jgi:DNA primase